MKTISDFPMCENLSDIEIDDSEWDKPVLVIPEPRISRQQRRHPKSKHGMFNRLNPKI